MVEKKSYLIKPDQNYTFHNHVTDCVGTGRMGLALQKEYQEQLAYVQSEIGFKYIRGHGLFADDLAIYQEYLDENKNTKVEYNFTYLDLVVDNYLSLGIRPFLELGFMPQKLALGDQTVFYWKGNVTPPKSYGAWSDLVIHTLSHLLDRYGHDEVLSWPIEVWNEPNLPGFWKDADMQEYFKLFEQTFWAIKELDQGFRVGGPAICGVEDELWMSSFMEFCHEHKIPLDFVTRHHYTTELPETKGHYGYAELSDIDEGFSVLHVTREIVDRYEEYKGLHIHITEFNTSYIPNCPLHDTNQNAAYVAQMLSRLGDDNESYSYWTFGDIFEEFGVPFTPFHGGFGLVANGCIPKPTFWTFRFFKDLDQGNCVLKTDNAVVMKRSDKSLNGVLFHSCRTRSGKDLEITLTIPRELLGSAEQFCMIKKVVDEESCNPLKCWHDLGEPANLSQKQKELIRESATPVVTTDIYEVDEKGVSVKFKVSENGLVYFEFIQRTENSDRGYDYKRVMQIQ
ncbi:MAG: xylan 1,4-beta-xylosidase [Clostridia bacterium]|nr:xylan 1,4-beta-xylosidase [Clostridia bacterium]